MVIRIIYSLISSGEYVIQKGWIILDYLPFPGKQALLNHMSHRWCDCVQLFRTKHNWGRPSRTVNNCQLFVIFTVNTITRRVSLQWKVSATPAVSIIDGSVQSQSTIYRCTSTMPPCEPWPGFLMKTKKLFRLSSPVLSWAGGMGLWMWDPADGEKIRVL